jgi:nicotinamidase-related amidase
VSLILVDIQNEHFPGGRMELSGIERASANAAVLSLFRERGWPPFHVQHLSQQAAHTHAASSQDSSQKMDRHRAH